MDNCIFCMIAAGQIPSETIYEDDALRVILDLGPAATGHALVLPKEHFADATEAPAELLGKLMKTGARIGEAQKKAFGCEGFNLVQNNGAAAGQSVFHLHLHVIPRRTGDGSMILWKPGKSTPEGLKETGEKLREAL